MGFFWVFFWGFFKSNYGKPLKSWPNGDPGPRLTTCDGFPEVLTQPGAPVAEILFHAPIGGLEMGFQNCDTKVNTISSRMVSSHSLSLQHCQTALSRNDPCSSTTGIRRFCLDPVQRTDGRDDGAAGARHRTRRWRGSGAEPMQGDFRAKIGSGRSSQCDL